MADPRVEQSLRRQMPVLEHPITLWWGIQTEGDEELSFEERAVFSSRRDGGTFERIENVGVGTPVQSVVVFAQRMYLVRFNAEYQSASFSAVAIGLTELVDDVPVYWKLVRLQEVAEYGRQQFMEIEVSRRLYFNPLD